MYSNWAIDDLEDELSDFWFLVISYFVGESVERFSGDDFFGFIRASSFNCDASGITNFYSL